VEAVLVVAEVVAVEAVVVVVAGVETRGPRG
jgi:hypothetical protein